MIEIKCEGASIPPHQVKNYSEAVRKGYPLHYFHVSFINFEKNQFEIRERVITNPDKVRYRV